MDLSDNLNNSFVFVRELFSDFGRLIILIVLDLIPIVNLIVTGYASRALKESPGANSPPKLENYGDMFMGGLKIDRNDHLHAYPIASHRSRHRVSLRGQRHGTRS